MLAGSGVHSTVGAFGYSYPLLLAELAHPAALMPPEAAAALFTAGSIVCLGLAVALLLSPLRHLRTWQLATLAGAIGLFGPVTGTLFFGQVNLYILPLLALASRAVQRPASLALAASVKLYPAALLLAFASDGRRGLRLMMVSAALTAGLALGPNLLTGQSSYGTSLIQMFGPDPYWSNQSINGWLSRLALSSGPTPALVPGLPVTPLMLIACVALGALTVAVLAGRRCPWEDAFSILLCYSVVAGPKNSLWNFTPLVVALVRSWTALAGRPWALVSVGVAWALISGLDAANLLRSALPGQPMATLLANVPLYGGLLLLAVVGLALVRWQSPGGPPHAQFSETDDRSESRSSGLPSLRTRMVRSPLSGAASVRMNSRPRGRSARAVTSPRAAQIVWPPTPVDDRGVRVAGLRSARQHQLVVA